MTLRKFCVLIVVKYRYSLLSFLILGFAVVVAGPHKLPAFYYNLSNLYWNHALRSEDVSQAERNKAATKSIYWLNLSGFSEERKLPGSIFKTYSVLDLRNGTKPTRLGSTVRFAIDQSLYYQDALEIRNLPSFPSANCLILLTNTSNSTLIEHGSELGFILLTTTQGNTHLKVVKIGIDVAEWAYDFPDMPPLHHKPANPLPLATGGLAYPIYLEIAEEESVEDMVFIFSYSQSWHVKPSWQLLELWVAPENKCSGVDE